jgi:hypothetical protein
MIALHLRESPLQHWHGNGMGYNVLGNCWDHECNAHKGVRMEQSVAQKGEVSKSILTY